jgi:dynein heavy chain
LNRVVPFKLLVSKQELNFIETSFVPHAQVVMGDSNFLKNVQQFGKVGKDQINEETIEFLSPYMELENFLPAVAKNASSAAEGLCAWVRAMKFYHEASKIVKPKLEALSIALGMQEAANKALAAAMDRLQGCKDKLAELQQTFENQMAEKRAMEDRAGRLTAKMKQASDLINGLSSENERWAEDAKNFADVKKRLVGDCAIACAFVSYLGPFNQEFRTRAMTELFPQDCISRNVPVTQNIDVIGFMVDVGTIGDWNMQGLPKDPLSVQNGILVTHSSRFPLLIDPQGQAQKWIRSREEENIPKFGATTLTHNRFKDQLEFCMSEGKTLVIINVEEDIDPMLDPVLEKQIIVKAKSKYINVADKNCEYDDNFKMYFITRLPNPHYSPELQAKTTVVDFTVTRLGLEEQLLGKVIAKEQKALEDQLNQVRMEVNMNTKALLGLGAMLLERLTSSDGNLLDDEELVGVLNNVKSKASEVSAKLVAADETQANISENREKFRPVATRGSVLYFSIVEVSLVNPMYQVSLAQFEDLFMSSMDQAEKANLAQKRVANIVETMTYITYRYINRGVYEKDKLPFILLVTMKILVVEGLLKSSDIGLLLRAGAALDINAVKRKPFTWLTNQSWLNVIELSNQCPFFMNLPNDISAQEAIWKKYYEDNSPEALDVPDYQQKIDEDTVLGPWYKLLVIRALRNDRTILCALEFISKMPQMGEKYTEPVTDTIDMIYDQMVHNIPVIYLLSTGADPTESIETLARKRKLPAPATVSLGQGQEPVAMKAMNAAAINGTWVLLQNCELGLGLMNVMEDFLTTLYENCDPAFRLFISALPSSEFPLGLLQMSTKVTNEPPAGFQAGLLRSYTVVVDQDRLERVDHPSWKPMLFNLCFIHSIVQERRKFGSLGWCIPYEYNTGDLTACIMFLEKHMYTTNGISWPTLQYMVCEAQYGGKITDDLDRRMFKLYAEAFITPASLGESFTFNPAEPINPIPKNFQYIVPAMEEIAQYRGYCSSMPQIDSPEIFGLHPNADLTFRLKEVGELFDTLNSTQPKDGGGGDGGSREDEVAAKAADLQSKLPEEYQVDDYKAKINALGGLSKPLNIFLYQEIQRLQNVIAKVKHTLSQIQLGIKGEVVMTDELQECMDALFSASVPTTWALTPGGDEFSWLSTTLGLWFTSFLARDLQDRTWLNSAAPPCAWLTGFFNPQGFLTAMKQDVCKKHREQNWALDEVVYHTEVSQFERADQVRSAPAEGVYIHGLFLEGAGYSKATGALEESEPKKLFAPLPVLYVSANTKTEEIKVKKELFGPKGAYECPCYKYMARGDRYRIFMVNLKTVNQSTAFWGMRGVALLCTAE